MQVRVARLTGTWEQLCFDERWVTDDVRLHWAVKTKTKKNFLLHLQAIMEGKIDFWGVW